MTFTHRGRDVLVPDFADIPPTLQPDGRYALLIQQMLSRVEPWEGKKYFLKTGRFNQLSSSPTALPLRTDRRAVWGIHKLHMGSDDPQLVPFARIQDALRSDEQTRQSITIELYGTTGRLALVRAVHGQATPPIPGSKWAEYWPGNEAMYRRFWRRHVYLLTERSVVPGTLTTEPPDWFTL